MIDNKKVSSRTHLGFRNLIIFASLRSLFAGSPGARRNCCGVGCTLRFNSLQKDKKAILGEGILTIYRLVLIAFIAFIVLGLAAVFYDYYIDVRGAEAQIMAKQVVNCLAPGGETDLGKFTGFENKILEYCGFDEQETERIYVVINVTNSLGEEIGKLENGDSGLGWVKEIYGEKDVTKYRPGVFDKNYSVFVLNEGKKEQGKIFVEVLISHEF